mmetsp:Transcript_15432/g.34664  ORF Transcript_15432/g.34664 Transcript_15432/m.34664 type:complete len:101 (-) Transcript_15432:17-319(-)
MKVARMASDLQKTARICTARFSAVSECALLQAFCALMAATSAANLALLPIWKALMTDRTSSADLTAKLDREDCHIKARKEQRSVVSVTTIDTSGYIQGRA